jgi:hypothetical protein
LVFGPSALGGRGKGSSCLARRAPFVASRVSSNWTGTVVRFGEGRRSIGRHMPFDPTAGAAAFNDTPRRLRRGTPSEAKTRSVHIDGAVRSVRRHGPRDRTAPVVECSGGCRRVQRHPSSTLTSHAVRRSDGIRPDQRDGPFISATWADESNATSRPIQRYGPSKGEGALSLLGDGHLPEIPRQSRRSPTVTGGAATCGRPEQRRAWPGSRTTEGPRVNRARCLRR